MGAEEKMKLFSTSALILASVSTHAIPNLFPQSTLTNVEISSELPVINRIKRSNTKSPSPKQMKKTLQDSSISDGVKKLKNDLKSGRFRKTVRNHGAQSIVDPSRLNIEEQYQMHKILGQKKALTGRQLLYRLSTTNANEEDLEKFKKWQKYLLNSADSFQAESLALVGIRYNGDDVQHGPDDNEDIDSTEETEPEIPVTNGSPYKHPRASMSQHPNRNYPKWAIQAYRPSPPSNFVTDKHPNANYPSYAIQNVGKNFRTNIVQRPPTAILKSALAGRGLPRGALAPRRPSPNVFGRYENADSNNYKYQELNSLKKEAKQTLVMIKSQTQKYNELVDLIKRAQVHVNNDNMLASVMKPSRHPGPTALQSEINRVNDELLIDLRREAAQRRKEEFLRIKRIQAEEAQKKIKAQAEQYKEYITKKLAIKQQDHNDNLLEKVSQIALQAAEAVVEDEDNEIVIDDSSEVHLEPEVADEEEPEVNWNRNKLDQVKQLFIPPLNSIDFFTQYKIAMWLKDHKEITPEDYANLQNVIPDPSLEVIQEYYYNQQKVLRREKLDGQVSWMKKLRKTLWKGLKPDPLPTN